MSAIILDGKATAAIIKDELRQVVSKMAKKPGLGTILVGDDPGSMSYVSGKHRDCAEVGINSIRIDLPPTASASDVFAALKDLNESNECTGYIVQLPLPGEINANKILESIDPTKDADGLHPLNLGKLVMGAKAPLPCTPRGKEVVVIGRGLTVGRPLGLLLSQRGSDSTVTTTHTKTKDLVSHTKRADIVIAAIGSAHFLTPEMVKPGAVVLDVGITRTSSGLQGDVHPDVVNVASAFAPMPGGVGPMTRAMLLSNVVEMAQNNS